MEGAQMLAVTSQAATAIDNLLATRELPEDAGLRISTEIDVSGDDGPAPAVQLELVEAPGLGDQVLEDAPVFVEAEAARLLQDKLLDAELAGDRLRFALRDRDEIFDS
jgi:Fe-S cluster assembly iron-binding protein IscA